MKKIIIVYDYFEPAFKAGGIIKSLKGIVHILKDLYQFTIITSAFDLKENKILNGIKTNCWVTNENYKIKYLSSGIITYFILLKDLIKFKNENIYFNGIYSFKFFIFPLFVLQLLRKKTGIIIAPRGMIQEGALEIKKNKKKIFLFFLKKLPIIKTATWHATDPQEKLDIYNMFGITSHIVFEKIIFARDTPLVNISNLLPPQKIKNSANFTTVSLITQKKNHLQFLKLLLKSEPNWIINYTIYGPIKDQDYWNECKSIINILPDNVKVHYKGFILPTKLEEAFFESHFFVLPTLGENFGHAILESLSHGRPVILSNKTPWTDVKLKKSGWIFDNEDMFLEILKNCMAMENEEFQIMSKSASEHASEFFSGSNHINAYSKLFN